MTTQITGEVICMSTERIIVDESVADALVEKLAAKALRLPAAIRAAAGPSRRAGA